MRKSVDVGNHISCG